MDWRVWSDKEHWLSLELCKYVDALYFVAHTMQASNDIVVPQWYVAYC